PPDPRPIALAARARRDALRRRAALLRTGRRRHGPGRHAGQGDGPETGVRDPRRAAEHAERARWRRRRPPARRALPPHERPPRRRQHPAFERADPRGHPAARAAPRRVVAGRHAGRLTKDAMTFDDALFAYADGLDAEIAIL